MLSRTVNIFGLIVVFCLPAIGQELALPELPPDVKEIVFAVRPVSVDGHWYANIGYYAADPNAKTYTIGGQLCKLNVETGEVTVLLDDPEGGIRDPQVHYDGKTILFSYRKGGTDPYHLYEINSDGTGLRQVTDGPFDDFEATYLPDDDIVFVSTRCKRWVNCWHTHVAVLYRCDRNGGNMRPISSNGEHDNTPWPLPDGRILYQRWEYVDRSQVHYHHLWTTNPDGTGQMVYYGNFHPGIVMIDAKPIPGTDDVAAIFSPNHGVRSHAGFLTVVSPKKGPDDKDSIKTISVKLGDRKPELVRDPYALSANAFLVAQNCLMVLVDATGTGRVLYRLPQEQVDKKMQLHEPRPIVPRERERVIPPRVDLTKSTGQLVLADVLNGRRMDGVKEGEIKKLLVLESLPMPIHYMGGMTPITSGGSFTLERVLGTVPVEADGSAYMELPALRSLFFVALDENNNSVKRMQSFLTVMPGETTSCVGCHEHRTRTPVNRQLTGLQAMQRPPSPIQPLEGIPEVYDFPRDIQPILDKHCVPCHGNEKREAGIDLTGARGPVYTHSYYTLTIRQQFVDGRNKPESSLAPRTIGAVCSPLMRKANGEHHDVTMSQHEKDVIRFWIEAGATYPGTYAALRSGMIGYHWNKPGEGKATYDASDQEWEVSKPVPDVINRRCVECHKEGKAMPRFLSENGGHSKFSRNLVFDLTDPEQSTYVRAPLAKEAGGLGICVVKPSGEEGGTPKPVFANKDDADYQKLLALCQAGKDHLEKITRFDMPEFVPVPSYVREMKRYGILPEDLPPDTPVDVYETERRYWESFWWPPKELEVQAAS